MTFQSMAIAVVPVSGTSQLAIEQSALYIATFYQQRRPRKHGNPSFRLEDNLMKNELRDLMTADEVAVHTGISIETLVRWRSQQRGIPDLKIGRSVRYDPLDVQQYLAGCRVSVSGPKERRWK